MNITYLELPTKDLQAQQDFYSHILELPVKASDTQLKVRAGKTDLAFTQAEPDFDSAYHFAFNVPENRFREAKEWITSRIPLLSNEDGKNEYEFSNWNAHAFYFSDAAGNILEFIARHDLQNAVESSFDSNQILQISEVGLPSPDVIGLANELCARLDLSVFRGQPNKEFTPVGDNNGLFIIPVQGRLWMPTHGSGIPANLLPVKVKGKANGKEWEVRGVPYQITY